MRKKTAQPRPKHRKTAESEKKKGLIAQKKTTGPSERAKFVLDNRSHRTTMRTYRLSWCVLLGRVFHLDVTVCPDCGGAMKIVAALTGMRLSSKVPNHLVNWRFLMHSIPNFRSIKLG